MSHYDANRTAGTTQGHAAVLHKALSLVDSDYFVKSSCDRSATLTLAGGEVLTFPLSPGDDGANLASLHAAARPSAFGKGDQTVMDPSVRVASEVPASDVTVDLDPGAEGILEQVRKALVPDATSVTAQLHKLNVMTAGGFFKAHQDTPRGAGCFGTLVVCLPAPFAGGALALRHAGGEVHVDWARVGWAPASGAAAAGRLHWVAFFGDVEHEVLPVTSGTRITLTYTLHRDDAAADVGAAAAVRSPLASRARCVLAALADALADPGFLPKGGGIGLHCQHLYEESALAAAEAKLRAGGAAAYASRLRLKGLDGLAAAALRAAGLDVQCLRMLKMEYLESDYLLAKMPTKREAALFGCYTCIEDSFTAMGISEDDVAAYAVASLEEQYEDVVWLGADSGGTAKWVEWWFSASGYFGNEASPATFYTSAAVMARVAPFAERGALVAASAAAVAALTPAHVEVKAAAAAAAPCNDVGGRDQGVAAAVGGSKRPRGGGGGGGAAALNTRRTVHLTGVHGGAKAASAGGCASVELLPGEGLRELKTKVRKAFGKARGERMACLLLAGADGAPTNRAAKTSDLVDGTRLHATYTEAQGNLANLVGSFWGGAKRGGGRNFRWCF